MKVALVCDWLVVYGGAERAIEEVLACFPQADIFAVNDVVPANQRGFLGGRKVRTSFIQHLPFSRNHYRYYLPLMPLAIEQFDLSSYDLVLSNSHAVAKGVLTGRNQIHVSYVHSPMRYAWDLQAQYLKESGLDRGLKGYCAKWLLHRMRLWDHRSAMRPDVLIANSHYIAKRIDKVWQRESTVIYPPVDTLQFKPGGKKENFYVTASRFVPYKKIDLIVESFSRMPDKQLLVIGTGPDAKKIHQKAGHNVHFTGFLPFPDLLHYLQRAKAFVFAAEEDFGIAPLEASACATPVIAYGKGGALETIRGLHHENPTGVFFNEQSIEALCDAVALFEKNEKHFHPEAMVAQASRFSPERFRNEFKSYVLRCIEARH